MLRLARALAAAGIVVASLPALAAPSMDTRPEWVSPYAGRMVEVKISLAQQTLETYVMGSLKYRWKISSGRKGYETPPGKYRPEWLHEIWYSSAYENAPMPHSIFFMNGYAIHGTTEVRNLGKPASHGCVRLDPKNAAELYALIQEYNKHDVRITIAD